MTFFFKKRKSFIISNIVVVTLFIIIQVASILYERFSEYEAINVVGAAIFGKAAQEYLYFHSNKIIGICLFILINLIVTNFKFYSLDRNKKNSVKN